MVIKLTSAIFVIWIEQVARITGAVKTTIIVITDVLTSTILISTFINICNKYVDEKASLCIEQTNVTIAELLILTLHHHRVTF